MNVFDYAIKLEELKSITTKKRFKEFSDEAFYYLSAYGINLSKDKESTILKFKLCTAILETAYAKEFKVNSNYFQQLNKVAGKLLEAYMLEDTLFDIDDVFEFRNTKLPMSPFRTKKLLEDRYVPFSLKYIAVKNLKDNNG